MTGYLYIFLTLIFTAFGQLILKWRLTSVGFELPSAGLLAQVEMIVRLLIDPYVFSGLAAAFIASLTWMAALSKFELSFAYPFMALNFILVPILGMYFLGESLSFRSIFGLALIFFGVVVVAKG